MKPLEVQIGSAGTAPGLRARLAQAQRTRLLEAFSEFMQEGGGGSVLQVGPRGALPADGLQLGTGANGPVVSCMLDVGHAAHGRFARADDRQLLYADGEFDWVLCENLLEHAGSFERQFKLLCELNRVAKKGVFVTTPNRRHPLDMGSLLPVLHWLPAGVWQRLFARAAGGRRLLSAQELKRMVSLLPGQPQSDIGHIRFMGPKAQFFLMLKKGG